MKINVCDVCGRRTDNERRNGYRSYVIYRFDNEMDLCNNCYEQTIKFIVENK